MITFLCPGFKAVSSDNVDAVKMLLGVQTIEERNKKYHLTPFLRSTWRNCLVKVDQYSSYTEFNKKRRIAVSVIFILLAVRTCAMSLYKCSPTNREEKMCASISVNGCY
jgi:hypothetical protein